MRDILVQLKKRSLPPESRDEIKNLKMLVNIQLLRALGALLVLLHHALPHYQAMGGTSSLITSIARWGFLGVDIFFVISGFIIAHTTMSKPRGTRSAFIFLWHRLARIFLGYWPFYALSLLLASHLAIDISGYNLIGSFFLLLLPQPSLVLPVSWSLSYELYFYAIFFALFWIPTRIIHKVMPVAFIALIAINLYFKTDTSNSLNFLLSGFLLEFFAGVIAGLAASQLKKIKAPGILVAGSIVAIAIGISNELVSLPYRALSYGTAGTLLVVYAITTQNVIRSRLARLANILGDASYTIYLSHLPLLSIFYLLGFRGWFTAKGTGYPEFGLAALVLMCLTFSVLFYFLIEKPLYRAAISFTKRKD